MRHLAVSFLLGMAFQALATASLADLEIIKLSIDRAWSIALMLTFIAVFAVGINFILSDLDGYHD